MNIMKKFILSLLISTSIVFCQPFSAGKNGVVVSASKIASDVGINIMQQGGNSIDATIAVNFALAVVWPSAGNIGGGGFSIIRFPDGTSTAINYRETAPGSATKDMYLDQDKNPINGLSTTGSLACGVPGTVAGMELLWKKYGSLKWENLLQPAIKLAENGFPVTFYLNQGLEYHKEKMWNFPATKSMFFPDDITPEIGDTIKFPDLAETLKRIAKKGSDGFYKGKTARLIAKNIKKAGGIITLNDLKKYQAQELSPITFSYRNYEIISMPPPSSGGICLAQILKIVERFPISEYGFLSTQSIQAIVEAERQSYANRAHFLGDPDFIDIPENYLISDELTSKLIQNIDLSKAGISDSVSHTLIPESEQTTHFSIIDKDGIAVSTTVTLNSGFGSCFVVEGTGILMNNEMDDFSIKPGYPNIYGLIGAKANCIEPGKRMLSSMTPSIVTKNDSLKWVLGTPGGSTIITSVAQVIINLIDFNMSLREAVHAPRFHHQWLPDIIYHEKYGFSPELLEKLNNKGYKTQQRSNIGDLDAIEVDYPKAIYIGVPDNRRQSAASAY